MIKIWKYENAPKYLKDLQPDQMEGGWVLESPAELVSDVESVLLSKGGEILRHQLPNGTVVFFGRITTKR